MKKLKYILFTILAIFIFSGCSGKNVEVKLPENEVFKDKEKGYLVFSRPYNFLGGAVEISLVAFDKNDLETIKFIGILSAGERLVYKMDEGTHYIFTKAGNNQNIAKVDIKKGEIKYVNMGVNINMAFYPLVYEEDRLNLHNTLSNSTCSDNILKKYNFTKSVSDDSSLRTYKSPIEFEMKCDKDNKIVSVRDMYYRYTLDELKKVELVEATPSALKSFHKNGLKIIKNLQEYYPVWDLKFKNVQNIMNIKKVINDEKLNSFTSVNVISGDHDEKIEKELITTYIKDLEGKFKTYASKDNVLNLKINFDKYDDGNMLVRYLVSGFGLSGIGVIDINVEILDNENNLVSSFQISDTETGGFLGGINTLKMDTMKVITDYVENALLKK